MRSNFRFLQPFALGAGLLSSAACVDSVDSVELGDTEQAATFDWGSDCSPGTGNFRQAVRQNVAVNVGTIPVKKANIRIDLRSARDVDIQLFDSSNNTQIIAWPNGLLKAAGPGCARYKDVEYCYSGYNGGQTAATYGHEYIEIHGVTNTPLLMKAFGYQAGDAEVTYSWEAVNTCKEKGEGTFSQALARNAVATIGEIPAGKTNVDIRLTSAADLDIQLFDGATALVKWPDGRLNGAARQTLNYQGMTIIWSGYNGSNNRPGNEFITIQGAVTRPLTMRAFAYQAGTAQVAYSWGAGAGAACGGRTNPPRPACAAGLSCEDIQPEGLARDISGECHSETWCLNDEMARYNCEGLIHPMVIGQWGCEEFTCTWVAGPPLCPSGESICDAICAGEPEPNVPAGCPTPMCACEPPPVACPSAGAFCDAVCAGEPVDPNFFPAGCPQPGCACPPPVACPSPAAFCDAVCTGQPAPEFPAGCPQPSCACPPPVACPSPAGFCEAVCAGQPTPEFPAGCPQPGCACPLPTAPAPQ